MYFVDFFFLSNHVDPTVDPKHRVMDPSNGGLPVQDTARVSGIYTSICPE